MDQMSEELLPVHTYLVGLAFLDEEFRKFLLADPQAAANSVGISLTDTQVEFIASLNPDDLDAWLADAEPILGSPLELSGW